MAYTLDQIKGFSSNPGSIAAPGSYGEGRVYNIASILTDLKGLVQSGAVTVKDYLDISTPLVKSAETTTNSIAGGGSKKANAVNPAWQQIQSLGAVKNIDGRWEPTAPFSAREYASLPENVLPTQKEVNSGIIPLNLLPPVQRFRPDASPNTPGQPIAPGTPGTPTSPITPGATPGAPSTLPGGGVILPVPGATPGAGQPQPQVNPGVGGTPPVATPQPAAPGQPPVVGVIDPTTGQPIGVPVVGDPLNNSVPKVIDQSIIEQEGLRQQEQQRQAYEAERGIRAQRLTDLQALLTKQNDRQFSENAPGVYEDLNSRGLLRSSALGDALAKERAKLEAGTAEQFAQQGLTDRDADISGIDKILQSTQSFQTSGLERKFTLEDFNRESDIARTLGAQVAPTVKSGKSVLGGVASGAGAGAAAGTAISPGWGTAIGAGLGAVLGGTSAKGK